MTVPKHLRLQPNAYVLAADPAWIEESVASYYDFVKRIFVSFDETGTSWTGHPLDPTEAVNRLKAVSYTHLRAHETVLDLVCRLLLEKKKKKIQRAGTRKTPRNACESSGQTR